MWIVSEGSPTLTGRKRFHCGEVPEGTF